MMLEALRIVHAQNYIHRDVRFSNILLLDGGDVLLNDWGSSTTTAANGMHQLLQGSPEPLCPPRT